MKWIKFSEQLPPDNGTTILIAVKIKNKPDGIFLYDICEYYGGDIDDCRNWEGRSTWEDPLYWCHIEEPK
jgi:hypothetical protein